MLFKGAINSKSNTNKHSFIKTSAAALILGFAATACAPMQQSGNFFDKMSTFRAGQTNAGPMTYEYPYPPIYGEDPANPAPRSVTLGEAEAAPAKPTNVVYTPGKVRKYKVGAPYEVAGKWYAPAHQPDYVEEGLASWYGDNFQGRETANGETFDVGLLTAAHPTLALPSIVKVENLENGKSVIVRVNDRGPFVDNRLIDLSKAAAVKLGMVGKQPAKVRVTFVDLAPMDAPAPSGITPSDVHIAHNTHTPHMHDHAAHNRTAPVQTANLAPVPAPTHHRHRAHAPSLTPGAFAIQAGSFANYDNAKRLSRELAQAGSVEVKSAVVNGTTYYRVYVGQFSDRYAAENQLSSLGIDNARVVSRS